MNLGIISTEYFNISLFSPRSFETDDIVKEANNRFENVFLIDPKKVIISTNKTKATLEFTNSKSPNENIFDTVDILFIKKTRGAIDQIIDIATIVHKYYPNIVLFDSIESFRNVRPNYKAVLNMGVRSLSVI